LDNLLKMRGHDVVGIEYNKANVEVSRQAFPNINFYHFGVQDDPQLLLNEEKKLFDCVVSTEVIEHLYAPNQLLSYAHKVLTDDGILVVSAPYHGYLKNLAIAIAGKSDFHYRPWELGGHIKFWSRKSLSAFLTAHGFEVINFRACGRLPWLWKSMIITAKKSPLVAPAA
jgi:2-polyprenyl-6-hydroxyphenyl methylase/3-demethylubiquinone-9 3-methyltransferase